MAGSAFRRPDILRGPGVNSRSRRPPPFPTLHSRRTRSRRSTSAASAFKPVCASVFKTPGSGAIEAGVPAHRRIAGPAAGAAGPGSNSGAMRESCRG